MTEHFSETFMVWKGRERLNSSQFCDLGTLARQVFGFAQTPPNADKLPSRLVAEWKKPTRDSDFLRLLGALGKSPNARVSAVRRRMAPGLQDSILRPEEIQQETAIQLLRVRDIVESLVWGKLPSGHRESTYEDYQAAIAEMVRWEGPGPKGQDFFRATPAGVVLLSAIYGRLRGGFRCCRTCPRFVVFPGSLSPRPVPRAGRGFRQDYCNNCRKLGVHERGRFAWWRSKEWRKAEDRWRKSGFERLGLTTQIARRAHRMVAKAALQNINKSELPDWVARFAPYGKRGRPRKAR